MGPQITLLVRIVRVGCGLSHASVYSRAPRLIPFTSRKCSGTLHEPAAIKECVLARAAPNTHDVKHLGLLHHLTITVSSVPRSSGFYGPLFPFFGYEIAVRSERYEDWKRWDHETPHEISIVETDPRLAHLGHHRGAVGHHHHLAFCALDRKDVDKLPRDVLLPLAKQNLCVIKDAPCDCPEYGAGYYATFFFDPDGLKYEFVFNSNRRMRGSAEGATET